MRKTEQIVVGRWSEEGLFRPAAKQPETSTILDAVAWAKENLQDGDYSLIRKIPGTLRVGAAVRKTANIVEGD